MLLAATVPDTAQITRGAQGVLDSVLNPDGPSSAISPPDPVKTLATATGTLAAGLSSLDGLADRLPPSTLDFRLQAWLSDGCGKVNANLKAPSFASVPVLVVGGAQDRLLPSEAEADRLLKELGSERCSAIVVEGTGHAALDDRLDLLSLMDRSPLYAPDRIEAENRKNYVKDFTPPDEATVKKAFESLQPLATAVSPVFMSTRPGGAKEMGISAVPVPNEEGRPVLLVGNHQLYALDLGLLIKEFITERDTLPRGLAHPTTFPQRLEASRARSEEDGQGPAGGGGMGGDPRFGGSTRCVSACACVHSVCDSSAHTPHIHIGLEE